MMMLLVRVEFCPLAYVLDAVMEHTTVGRKGFMHICYEPAS